jgi:sugar (pentulose or hexulose) kinase
LAVQAIGIDIGSSSIKGAVLNMAERTLSTPVMRPFPGPIVGNPSGWVEIDPNEICRTVDEVLSSLMAQSPAAERVFFSGQMGGVILLDDRARPLTNYLSWRDQRALEPSGREGSLFERLLDTLDRSGHLVRLGRELQPGSETCLLAWLGARCELPRDAIPTCIADFVLARLIGRPIPMHATQAIGLLDLTQDQWHRSALASIGLGDVRLPDLSLTEECVGTVRIKGRRVELFGSYGDQQCALRGATLQRGELSLNISTGSQVSRRVPTFHPGDYQSRKYFFGDYLDTVTHIPAGRSLNVIIDLLTELARAEGISLPDPWNTIQRKVEEVVESDLEVDLAFFRSPVGERGRIDGITTENLHVGSLFVAAYRSLADNCVRLAHRFSESDWKSVVLSGGLTKKAPRLRQLIEQRFSVCMRESMDEETLLGLLDIAVAARD